MPSNSEKNSWPPHVFKVGTVLFGMAVVALGLYSHFNSYWVKEIQIFGISFKLYELCEYEGVECPKIIMERFFVYSNVTCFVLSVCGLSYLILRATPNYLLDIGFHSIASVLLLAAGILYIVSAQQIYNLVEEDKGDLGSGLGTFNFRRPEKFAAGILSILLGILHGFKASRFKRNKNTTTTSLS